MIAERRIKTGEEADRRARLSGGRARKALRPRRMVTSHERDRQDRHEEPRGATPTGPPTARERTA